MKKVEIPEELMKALNRKFGFILASKDDPAACYEELQARVYSAENLLEQCTGELLSFVRLFVQGTSEAEDPGIMGEVLRRCALSPLGVCVSDKKAVDDDGVQRERCLYCGISYALDIGSFASRKDRKCRYCFIPMADEVQIYAPGENQWLSCQGYAVCPECVRKAQKEFGEGWEDKLAFGYYSQEMKGE